MPPRLLLVLRGMISSCFAVLMKIFRGVVATNRHGCALVRFEGEKKNNLRERDVTKAGEERKRRDRRVSRVEVVSVLSALLKYFEVVGQPYSLSLI